MLGVLLGCIVVWLPAEPIGSRDEVAARQNVGVRVELPRPSRRRLPPSEWQLNVEDAPDDSTGRIEPPDAPGGRLHETRWTRAQVSFSGVQPGGRQGRKEAKSLPTISQAAMPEIRTTLLG